MGGDNGRAVPLRGLRRSAGGQADDERALFADELSFVGSSLAGGRKFLPRDLWVFQRAAAISRIGQAREVVRFWPQWRWSRPAPFVGRRGCRPMSKSTTQPRYGPGKCLESVGLQQHSLTATQPSRTIADL